MATQTDATPSSPSKEQWEDLCRDVKAQLLEEMGEESWYLIIVSACLCLNVAVFVSVVAMSCSLVWSHEKEGAVYSFYGGAC